MNFLTLLEKQAKDNPKKPAVVFGDAPIDFTKLKEQSLKVAGGLSALGFKKSEKVAVFLPNIPEYIFSFLGVFALRGTCVPLDFMLTEEEIVNFLNHSQSKILIASPKKGLDFKNIKSRCPALESIVFFAQDSSAQEEKAEGFLSWEDLVNESGAIPQVEAQDDDTAAIFYTSGSTGHPKGVPLTYKHMRSPIDTLEYYIHPGPQEIFLCAGVPFSHLGGLDYILFMLYFSCTMVLMDRFHPFEFIKNLQQHKITIFCIVPAMYVAVLSMKEYDKFDLSSLKYAVVFGAPSSPVLLERFHKGCPNAYLLNGWGMTETAAPNVFLPTGTKTKEIPNTGKFPPWIETKIVDDQGNALEGQKEGELLLRGWPIMKGYYKEPGLTKEALTDDGWFKTGDVVKRDELDRYSIVGRKKEMIKVGGEIVFCPEVEGVIHRHPKVGEVAVVGVPDKLRGEVPKAFIVLKEDQTLSTEDLRYFLKEQIAHFKIPHHFKFQSSLPKNRVGKIDKESLKKSTS